MIYRNSKLKIYVWIITSIVLAVSFGTNVAFASTKIQANSTKAMGFTAKEWYSSSETRAILTVSLAVDTFTQMTDWESDDLTSFLVNTSYVGKSSSNNQVVVVGYYGSTTILVMVYTPSSNEIEYEEVKINGTTLTDTLIDSTMVSILNGLDKNGTYEKNDASDIMDVVNSLLE